MADNQNTNSEEQNNDGTTDEQQTQNSGTTNEEQASSSDSTDVVAKLVAEQVESALKPIKEKLDNAYKARDAAEAKLKQAEKEAREANLKRLQDEGKHAEALKIQLDEEKSAREAAERRNVELTRDLELKSVLSNLPFRSDNAREMANRDIVGQLVRDDNGNWIHKSGVSIKDFAAAFSEHADNAFLFKPKVSSGGGSSTTKPSESSDKGNTSVFAMSQEEVLKRAKAGTLRKR